MPGSVLSLASKEADQKLPAEPKGDALPDRAPELVCSDYAANTPRRCGPPGINLEESPGDFHSDHIDSGSKGNEAPEQERPSEDSRFAASARAVTESSEDSHSISDTPQQTSDVFKVGDHIWVKDGGDHLATIVRILPEELEVKWANLRTTQTVPKSACQLVSELTASGDADKVSQRRSKRKRHSQDAYPLPSLQPTPDRNNQSSQTAHITTVVMPIVARPQVGHASVATTPTPVATPSNLLAPNTDNSAPSAETEVDDSVPASMKVKKEKGVVKNEAKQDRIYGDRVLLRRQASNGMMKLGGGNVGMFLLPGPKNPGHPCFDEVGNMKAIAYNDDWQPFGPTYAGQPGACVGTVYGAEDGEPFAVFMKRSVKGKTVGWKYCGQYRKGEGVQECWTPAYEIVDRHKKETPP